MNTASIAEIKKELLETHPSKVLELCLRLAKFKKENKELLTFLLFEAHDIESYIENVKNEMCKQFKLINKSNTYFVKKSLRKILRATNKYIRYSNSEMVEIELLIYFLIQVKEFDDSIKTNTVICNIYQNQLKKIQKTMETLHEELQYDYLKKITALKSITA